MFASMTISRRLMLIVAVAAVGTIGVSVLGLTYLRENLLAERGDKTEQLVAVAYSIAADYHARALAGEMTDEEAKQAALSVIGTLRYGQGNYLWVNDMAPVMLVHPRKDLIGRNLADMEDPSGFRLFDGFLRTVRAEGAGFVPYLWPKPGQDEPVRKLSYVRGFEPWGWVIGTGVYLDDVEAIFWHDAAFVGGIALVLLALVMVVAFVIARGITRPIGAITGAMQRLSQGDLSTPLPQDARGDEVGDMLAAIRIFREHLDERLRMADEQLKAEQERTNRQHRIDALTRDFTGAVGRLFESVSDAVKAVSVASDALDQRVGQTSAASNEVVNAADQTSVNVEAVAAAAVELAATVQEIQRQVEHAAAVATDAVKQADATTERVRRLDQTVHGIGDVLKLISDIAAKTNLLALNATIEAARAGDAGRGFAVVANEVKTLAGQTAQATQDIAQRITEVQADTASAVEAIGGVVQVIGSINEIAASISAAMVEQGAAADEIAGNASGAATATRSVSHEIGAVSQAAHESAEIVQRVSNAANRVFTEAEHLRSDVGRYLAQVEQVIGGGEADESIPTLTWTEALSVGNQTLDADHKRLFRLFNRLSEAMRTGQAKAVIQPILDELLDYAAVHFRREEEAMAAAGYKDLPAHRKQHEAFVKKAMETRDRFAAAAENTLAIETMAFVRDWLINHIQKSDRAYTPYLGAKKVA